MRSTRAKTIAKRSALAFILGIAASSAPQTAWGQLVDTAIAEPNRVVPAQAVSPQDAVPVEPSPQLEPPGPESLPGGQAVPPPISQPFANPLPSPDSAFQNSPLPSPAAPTPNLGQRSRGLGLSASLGVTAGSYSYAPTMMGDLFGSGISIIGSPQQVVTDFFSDGTIISGSGSTAVLAFDFGTGTPNDVFTMAGSGVDISGDGQIDQFDILEPIPPTDAPTSPGPGFVFAGGEAVYTDSTSTTDPVDGIFGNGDTWYIKYSYVSSVFANGNEGVIIAGPDVASRRSKLSENFSPELRDRFFFNYNFFNDAFGGLGDVSRYLLGMERILIDDMMSVEVRLPMAGTLASRQQIDRPGDRSFELGNMSLLGKFLLLKTDTFTFTGGTGVTIPLADDARLLRGNDELLRIENQSVHILPFLSLLTKLDRRTFFQVYTQFDVDVNGNPVQANLTGGPLQGIGTINDSTLAHVDTSVHRIVYENLRPTSVLKAVVANAELHYTGTLQGSDTVSGQGITVGNLKENFNILNATFGTHLVLGNNLIVTPGMSIPLRTGLDEQFDYEALLQVNYLR